MNLRDLFFPFIFALSMVLLFNYFFFNKKDGAQYQFVAPQSSVECMPLNRTIDFVDAKLVAPKIETVETAWGTLEFSTHGAVLTRLEFERVLNGRRQVIGTIFPPTELETGDRAFFENRAFLVALQERTPFLYRHVNRSETADTVELIFEGISDQARITKTFMIDKRVHRITLKLSIDPKGDIAAQARILYPAPFMPALKEQNLIAGDMLYGADVFKKLYRDTIKQDTFWVHPLLFGAENKYFMHSLLADSHGFTQRAYYKLGGQQQLFAILEGPAIQKETEWILSFYMGPKEGSAMAAVDARLERALDYSGFWAPISRLLLLILSWLFAYLHNYGLAIVVLTILIKVVLLPFSLRADRGMKERLEQQKRLQYIKQKYKDDPQARSQAEIEFMKKYGLGLAGCLPQLAQVPIFFGLSRVLSSSIELYGAPFLWMRDLSAPDPYYVLPILVGLGILLSAASAPDLSQRFPMMLMAIVVGAFTTSFSAGVVLYLALSGVLNLAQTRIFKLFGLIG